MNQAIASLVRPRVRRPGFPRFTPSLILRGRRYHFQPTFFGLVYLGMVAALLVGSINHNNNLGYLLTFLLGGILLVTLPHGFRNLRGISMQGGQGQPVFAGQQASFDLHLPAEKQERYAIHLALDPAHPVEIHLPADQPATVRLHYPAKQRGLFHLDGLHAWTSYPLGLIAIRTLLDVKISCLVYPAPITSPPISEPGDDTDDQSRANALSAGRDFSGLTQYRPGDSLHQAHWKSLAQGRSLHTKHFEEHEGNGLVFSLERLPGTDLESRLGRICHMVLAADSRGQVYGLRLGSQFIAPNKGPAHNRRCLEALALHQ